MREFFCYTFRMKSMFRKMIGAVLSAALIAGCGTASVSPKLTVSEGSDFAAAFVDLLDPGNAQVKGTSLTVHAWQNETADARILVQSAAAIDALQASCSDLVSSDGSRIPAAEVQLGFVAAVSASKGKKTVQAEDVITDQASASLASKESRTLWVRIAVGADTPAGSYAGTITLQDAGSSVDLALTAEVSSLSLPTDSTLTLELWQYPYSSLRYYGFGTAFSPAHLEYLKKELQLYKDAGGSAVAVSVQSEPWGHQTYDDYPSMIQWTRNADYSWSFDFSAFDAWVETCEEAGIDGRILSFSLLPSYNKILFQDEVTGQQQTQYLEPGSEDWKTVWGLFLDYYIIHLVEKGWLDRTYIAIDEKDEADTQQVISLLQAHHSDDGRTLKLAAYISEMPQDVSMLDQIDAVSFAENVVQQAPEQIAEIAQARRDAGMATAMYTCTGQYPNSFAYSEPAESVWTALYAGAEGMSGFARWAMNAYNEQPLVSTDVETYESGDTMLMYPGPEETPYPSVRLQMIARGVRDAGKYRYLLSQVQDQDLKQQAQDLLDQIAAAKVSLSHQDASLVRTQAQQAEEMISRLEQAVLQGQ